MTIADAFRKGVRRALFVFAIFVVVGIAAWITAITVIGIPFAVLFAVRWSLAIPAAIDQKSTVDRALGTSWRLVKPRFWRTAKVYAAFTAIIGVPLLTVSLVVYLRVIFDVGAFFDAFRTPGVTTYTIPRFGVAQIIAGLALSIAWAATIPIWALLTTILYDEYHAADRNPATVSNAYHKPTLAGSDGLDV